MTALRVVRAAAIALVFAVAVTLSQRATLAREGETLPGVSWAIAALSVLFLVSALVSERTQGPEANLRKDLMWGLGAGGIVIILSRL
jgi:hypothetical protein